VHDLREPLPGVGDWHTAPVAPYVSDPVPDVLGGGWTARTIEFGPNDGPAVATLVSPASRSELAVLYVHGFCDYFFHAELADRFAGAGWTVHGLDLRRHGRSLRPYQLPNFVTDLAEHHVELDAAYDLLAAEGARRIVVIGHSTGGLVVSLWADARRRAGLPVPDALVLNSPWLDHRGPWWQRTVGTRVLHQVGAARPHAVLPRAVSGVYVESLHRDLRGEWDFDTAWKPAGSFPVRAGWLRAVRQGHAAVHRGIEVGAPVLVLASGATASVQDWDEIATRTDTVLDVEQIAHWANRLGSRVTLTRLDGAVHDVYLSARPVRDRAYDVTLRWLDAVTAARG